TLGSTAAHAPQKSPSTRNPAPVAIRLRRTGRCYERGLVSGCMDPDLSVVVTVLNEAASVDELYRRAVAALDGRTFELVFVDDGSTDGTFAALARLHTADPRVRAVRLKRNFGQHPAMHAGLSRARGSAIVTMDGDLQNAPEEIPKLVATLDRVDVASGRRVGRRDPLGR